MNLGSTAIGSLYLGSTKIGEAYLGSVKVYASADPYNPLNLPAHTMRLQFTSGFTPVSEYGDITLTQVSASPNVWDITWMGPSMDGTSFANLFAEYLSGYDQVTAVLGFNATGIVSMESAFRDCTQLTSVALFYMGDIESTYEMFSGCTSLTTVADFNMPIAVDCTEMFSGCTSLTAVPHLVLQNQWEDLDTSSMFYGCVNVQSGALTLYNELSTQTKPPRRHVNMFTNCGSNTVTGAAELSQIPSSWGGTGA